MFNSDWLAKNQSAAAAAEAAPAADAEESAFFSKFWGGGETGEGTTDGSSLLPTTFGGSAGNDNFLSLSRGDRFKGFVLCLLCSAFFFLLGFFVGLPTVRACVREDLLAPSDDLFSSARMQQHPRLTLPPIHRSAPMWLTASVCACQVRVLLHDGLSVLHGGLRAHARPRGVYQKVGG
jgi:hypothetical protein